MAIFEHFKIFIHFVLSKNVGNDSCPHSRPHEPEGRRDVAEMSWESFPENLKPYQEKFQEERELAVTNFRKFLIPRKKGWSEGSPVPISPCIHGDPGAVGCKQTPPLPSFLPSEEPTSRQGIRRERGDICLTIINKIAAKAMN